MRVGGVFAVTAEPPLSPHTPTSRGSDRPRAHPRRNRRVAPCFAARSAGHGDLSRGRRTPRSVRLASTPRYASAMTPQPDVLDFALHGPRRLRDPISHRRSNRRRYLRLIDGVFRKRASSSRIDFGRSSVSRIFGSEVLTGSSVIPRSRSAWSKRMRLEFVPGDSVVEPRHWVRHDQAFAMMLGPGSIEWGSKRSALEKFDYTAGDLALCDRHVGEWVGLMTVPHERGNCVRPPYVSRSLAAVWKSWGMLKLSSPYTHHLICAGVSNPAAFAFRRMASPAGKGAS